MESVLLEFLLLVILQLGQGRHERQVQPPGKAPGEIRYQFRMCSRRHTSYPLWGRLWIPAFRNHFRCRLYQLVTEIVGVLSFSYLLTPARVTPIGIICGQFPPDHQLADCP